MYLMRLWIKIAKIQKETNIQVHKGQRIPKSGTQTDPY